MRASDDEAAQAPEELVGESRRERPEPPVVRVPSPKAHNLLVRACSGFVYVALNVAALFLGTPATALLMSVTAGITCWEFYRLMRADAKQPNQPLGIAFALIIPFGGMFNPVYLIGWTFLLMICLGLWYVLSQRARITDLAVTLFGVLYTSLMLCAIVMIRKANLPGMGSVILATGVMASVWVNDSTAYLVGSKFGRHPLVPKISPKKSWEGLFGGLVGSVATWVVISLFPETGVTLPVALAAGVACGIAGVVGDLVESRIKRGAGVKDSGNIIPGHGGLLDRSDSLLFTGTAAYFVLRMTGVI